MKSSIKIIFIVLSLFFAESAYALCSVSTVAMNFPAYDVLSALPTDSTGSVILDCDETPPAKTIVSMGQSFNSGGFNPRQMNHAFAADFLLYNLYTDATYTIIWGDGIGGGSSVKKTVTKNQSPVTLVVYGRIPALQNVGSGLYSDSVVVTVDW